MNLDHIDSKHVRVTPKDGDLYIRIALGNAFVGAYLSEDQLTFCRQTARLVANKATHHAWKEKKKSPDHYGELGYLATLAALGTLAGSEDDVSKFGKDKQFEILCDAIVPTCGDAKADIRKYVDDTSKEVCGKLFEAGLRNRPDGLETDLMTRAKAKAMGLGATTCAAR